FQPARSPTMLNPLPHMRNALRPLVARARWLRNLPKALLLHARGVRGERPTVLGRVLVYSATTGSIRLGNDVVLAATPRSNSLEARGPVILRTLRPSASITIGRDSGLTSTTIS